MANEEKSGCATQGTGRTAGQGIGTSEKEVTTLAHTEKFELHGHRAFSYALNVLTLSGG